MLILVEVLECFLVNRTDAVLEICLDLKIDEFCETLSSQCVAEPKLSLVINRILMILSLYKMGRHFDGIKVVQKDPAEITGFLAVIKREIEKGFCHEVCVLCYYTAKYYRHVAEFFPKFFCRGLPVFLDEQATLMMTSPLHIATLKLQGGCDMKSYNEKMFFDDVSYYQFLRFMFDRMSPGTIELGYTWFDKLSIGEYSSPASEFAFRDTYLWIIDRLIMEKSTIITSPEMGGAFFSLDKFILEGVVYYLSNGSPLEPHIEQFISGTLDLVRVHAESYDITWQNSLASLDITDVIIELLSLNVFQTQKFLVKTLYTLKALIDKNISTSMALLLDTKTSAICKIGPLLYSKLLDVDADVRNATMSVVLSIGKKASKNFQSFQKILIDANLPSLVFSLAFGDLNIEVRSRALVALQYLVTVPDICHQLIQLDPLNKLLNLLQIEQNEEVRKEAIIPLLSICKLCPELKSQHEKLFKTMTNVTLRETSPVVKLKCMLFWMEALKFILYKQGMTDWEFPPAVFSSQTRKIVKLNDLEIKKRLITAISELTDTGLIVSVSKVMNDPATSREVLDKSLEIIEMISMVIKKYELTPEWFINEPYFPHQKKSIAYENTDEIEELLNGSFSSPINGSQVDYQVFEENKLSVMDILLFSHNVHEDLIKSKKEQDIKDIFDQVLDKVLNINEYVEESVFMDTSPCEASCSSSNTSVSFQVDEQDFLCEKDDLFRSLFDAIEL